MDLLSVFLLAVGLSMDAFAVSICKGLSLQRLSARNMAIVGAWFGGFQFLMPMLGFLLSNLFEAYIETVSTYVAFVLLLLIGGNMAKEALDEEPQKADDSLHPRDMLVLAVATSIDALAVGVTLTCVPVDIVAGWGVLANNTFGCILIGITTFCLSMIGVKVGSVFGSKYEKRAQLAGGVILILLGFKILIEHWMG